MRISEINDKFMRKTGITEVNLRLIMKFLINKNNNSLKLSEKNGFIMDFGWMELHTPECLD